MSEDEQTVHVAVLFSGNDLQPSLSGPWKVKANYTLLGRGEARSSRDVTLYIDGIRMRNCVQSGPANVDSEGNIISARPAFIDEHTGDCGFL